MSTVLVYKTDISDSIRAKEIVTALQDQLSECIISIDLEDCDNVLRIETKNDRIPKQKIRQTVENFDFQITTLL